ncbi:MAG: rplV [Candidatus Berkelbacteria bacterium]|nr:rplV [Candidatus Berkelbacteria bacterium]
MAQELTKIKPEKIKPVAKPKAPVDVVVKSRFVRMAPDKIRLVGKVLVGKDIETALNMLQFIPKAAANKLKLVVLNAKNIAKSLDLEKVWIKTVIVNEGPKLKRRRIIHRGKATNILKRMSHIQINLSTQNPKIRRNNGQ